MDGLLYCATVEWSTESGGCFENLMIPARLSGSLSRGRGMYARKDGMIRI